MERMGLKDDEPIEHPKIIELFNTSLVLDEDVETLPVARIARVEVVPLGERDRGRSDELGVETVDRAGGVAEHAVDAHAELLVGVELVGGLEVLPVDLGHVVVPDDPRLDPGQLLHEVGHVHDQVPHDHAHACPHEGIDPAAVAARAHVAAHLLDRRPALHRDLAERALRDILQRDQHCC